MSDWIPITERLPKPQQFVLIAYDNKKVTMGWHVPAKTVESGCREEVDEEYDEESDTYYLCEQWVSECRESEYHYSISNVTHWMPLPEYPK
jgi:hypothetical protein